MNGTRQAKKQWSPKRLTNLTDRQLVTEFDAVQRRYLRANAVSERIKDGAHGRTLSHLEGQVSEANTIGASTAVGGVAVSGASVVTEYDRSLEQFLTIAPDDDFWTPVKTVGLTLLGASLIIGTRAMALESRLGFATQRAVKLAEVDVVDRMDERVDTDTHEVEGARKTYLQVARICARRFDLTLDRHPSDAQLLSFNSTLHQQLEPKSTQPIGLDKPLGH